MYRIVLACTERQPAEACDKAVSLILTDPRLGQRSSYQRCSLCEKWFIVANLEFEFSCTLEKATDSLPTVECELRTRYPTFTCRDCAPCGNDEHRPAEGQDDWLDNGVMQLSPDHTAAVYRMRSSDGTKNLVTLEKTFTFTCPKCGQESPEPLRTPQEVQHYIQQHMDPKRHTGLRTCKLQLEAIAQGRHNTPAVYGSKDMNSSPVEVQVITWMSRLLVVVALHILSKTRSSSSGSSDQHLYLPWRSWAVNSLTEDTQLIAAANWIRPNLVSLSRSPWHNLLDMILAPPYMAAAEQDAGMTAHKLAVLMKCKAKQLRQRRSTGLGVKLVVKKLPATAQGVCALLSSMLAEDALFKQLPAEERIQAFLAMASISAEEVAAALTLDFVRATYLEVCPCCAVPKEKLFGCSSCIICLKCTACQAAAGGIEQQQTRAAQLCPWCEGHSDAAISFDLDWRRTLMTDEEFSSLGITNATAEQRRYFTKWHKNRSPPPWKISQWLSNGFIIMLVKNNGNFTQFNKTHYTRWYIAPNGDRLYSTVQMSAWVQTNKAAAAAAAAATAAAAQVQGVAAGTSAAAAAGSAPPGHAGGHSVEHIDLTASPRSDAILEDPGSNVKTTQQLQPIACKQDCMSAAAATAADRSQQATAAATQLRKATAVIADAAGATAASPPAAVAGVKDAAHLQNIPCTSAAAAAAQQQTGLVSADAVGVDATAASNSDKLKKSLSGATTITSPVAAAGTVATSVHGDDSAAPCGVEQQQKRPRTAVHDEKLPVLGTAAVAAGTSASDWHEAYMTDEEFTSLGILDATAEQRKYFTKEHNHCNPWKIDGWLPNGFIVLRVKSTFHRSGSYYIAPNGSKFKSKGQMNAWVQQNTAAAAAAGTSAAQVAVAKAASGPAAAAASAPPHSHAGGRSVEHIDLTASPRRVAILEDPGSNVNGIQKPLPTACKRVIKPAPAATSAGLIQQATVATTQLPAATAAVANGAGATAPSPPIAVVADENAAHLRNIPCTSAAAAAGQQQTDQVSADAGCVDGIAAFNKNRLKRSLPGGQAVTPPAAAAFSVATVKGENDNAAPGGAEQQHKRPRTAVHDEVLTVPGFAAAIATGTSAAAAAAAAAAGGAQSPAAAAFVKTETACLATRMAADVAIDVPGVAAVAANIPLAAAATSVQPFATAAAVDAGVPHAAADAAAIAGATAAASAQHPAIATAAAAQALLSAAAAATSNGTTTDIICKRSSLVKSIDHVLFRTLLSVRSLRSSQATNTLYNTRLQLKQLAATEPDEAMLGLEVMHQFVSCLDAAKLCDDVFLMPGMQQLLDECLLQPMREQCVPRIQHLLVKSWLRIVPKQCSSATAAGSATVLDMLLFCWSTEYQATQCRSSDGTAPSAAVSAEAAVGLCPVTLQVMLKAWKLAAAAAPAPAAAPTIRYDEQSITSVSQLGLQLVQGLCKLLLSCPENPPDMQNSAGHLAASSVDTIQQRSLLWQYAMELCLDVVNTVPDIAAEVAKVFKDWEA